MPEVSEPGALNYYTLSPIILWIFTVSKNSTLTHVPLSGSLDFLLRDLIKPTAGLAFFFLMTRKPAAVSSFSSGRAYPSQNFPPFLSLFAWPYSDSIRVNISLKNFSSLSFLNVYAPPICSSSTDSRTDCFSLSIFLSSRNLFILGHFNCYHSLWDSKGTSDPREYEIFDWVISFDPLLLMTLTLL